MNKNRCVPRLFQFLLLGSCWLIPVCSSFAATPEDEQAVGTITAGMLDRFDAIRSGIAEFNVKLITRDGSGASTVDELINHKMRAAIDKDQWALRYRTKEGWVHPQVCLPDRLMTFAKAAPNARHKFLLNVELPREMAIPTQPETQLFRGGTVCFDQTRKFIAEHLDRARKVRNEQVAGVDTVVLEWDVATDDLVKAFHWVDNQFFGKSGQLRLYVAPELGYAVPRYEYVRADGGVGCRIEAEKFRKYAPAVFLPEKYRIDCINGKSGVTFEYEYLKIDRINRSIPEQEFQFVIPADTSVSDSRPRQYATFVTRKALKSDELEEWLDEQRKPSSNSR